ncbi:MAG: aldolase [Desulfovibrio sp. MES5]|uniref:class II aldolase/adducin family protein n=1 Tax=Desulfovibrio sp. MES5 TaxID=1899016 RepID=UPI000B9D07ED|nr:class II aldolase/adducin family protein [Desulfovibrio sp. MES5]OXS29783.1 MAG: aldolase [Desulfovibrio sp. MES5]
MHKDFQSAPEVMKPYVEEMRDVCRDAWTQGLLSGCNGNASRRLPAPHQDVACLTCTGAAKGRLAPQNCCLVEIESAAPLYGGPASTESGMHLAIYRAKPQCGAILHTHPRRLLALSLRLEKQHSGLEDFLRLPLFEADVWRARLGFALALPPGTTELADAVARASLDHPAVWMAGHGLCSTGATLAEALCLTEELEHLAAIQLLSMR